MLQQQQQQHEQVVPTFDLHPQAMKQAQKELSHAKTSITLLKNDQDVRATSDLHPQAMKQAQKELSHAKKSKIASLENDQDGERKTIHQNMKRRKLMIPTCIRPTSDLVHATCIRPTSDLPRRASLRSRTTNLTHYCHLSPL